MIKNCIVCNKEFKVKPAEVKKGYGKYCSRTCKHQDQRKYFIGENNPRWIGGMSIQICNFCKREFKAYSSQEKKFCSPICGNASRRGKRSKKWNQQLIACDTCNKNISRPSSQIEPHNYCSKRCLYIARKGQHAGENNYNWKGDKVGYSGLHVWIRKTLGKAILCQRKGCVYPRMMRGRNKLMLTAKRYEWANISHEYKRELSDWIQLCTSCHALYDRGKLIL